MVMLIHTHQIISICGGLAKFGTSVLRSFHFRYGNLYIKVLFISQWYSSYCQCRLVYIQRRSQKPFKSITSNDVYFSLSISILFFILLHRFQMTHNNDIFICKFYYFLLRKTLCTVSFFSTKQVCL